MTSYPEPGRVASGVLAISVHLVFVALLVFGINWQQKMPQPIVAELWQELPTKPESITQAPPEPPPPPPPPKRELPPPEPPKPTPAVKPTPPQAEPSKADIALKEKQRKLREKKLAEEERRQEELRKKEEELRKKELARKEHDARLREAKLKEEEQKREQAVRRKEEERLQEEAKRDEERRLAKDAEVRRAELLEQEKKQAQAAKAKAEEDARKKAAAEAAAAKQRALDQYVERIKAKIRNRVVVPPGIGNPEAVYQVTLLPGGEVLDIKLVKSSGSAAYDAAVERAIQVANPLPVPSEPDLFQQMRQVSLKFRPVE